jgi:hypothetical protein
MFGSPTPPPVAPLNTPGIEANQARAAAEASRLEAERLRREKGASSTVLTDQRSMTEPIVGKKTVLGT